MTDNTHDDNAADLALSHCLQGVHGLGSRAVGVFRSKESDFLRLGGQLQEFSSQAQAVYQSTLEITRLTSGHDIQDITDALDSHLDKTCRLGEQVAHEQSLDELATIGAVGHKLNQSMAEFNRMVKRLAMLGVATRIESARLGSAGLGFSTLADDVETLAAKIATSSATILNRATELTRYAGNARERTGAILSLQQKCSQDAAKGLHADIDHLTALTDNSRAAAQNLAAKAQAISESVSQVVLSMQIHDIIRQQLEHVDETLDQMATLLPGAADEDPLEVLTWAYNVASLQLSQIQNARDRFGQAVDDLTASLRAVGHDVADMAAAVAELSGKRGDAGGGVLASIQRHVEEAAGSLRNFLSLRQNVSEVMEGVGSAIRDMASSVAEIEEVGEEIELIAINASIKAAHTGDEGKALGVLATAVQKLSAEARGQSDAVTAILGEMETAAATLSTSAAGYSDAAAIDSMTAALHELLDRLVRLHDEANGQLADVNRREDTLARDIAQAVNAVDFPEDILAALDQTRDQLNQLVLELKPHVPPGQHAYTSSRLQGLMSRYTMEAERLVHESMLGLSDQAASLPESAPTSQDGLGDNVELF